MEYSKDDIGSKLDKEKVKKAKEMIELACLHCGKEHMVSCYVDVARRALDVISYQETNTREK